MYHRLVYSLMHTVHDEGKFRADARIKYTHGAYRQQRHAVASDLATTCRNQDSHPPKMLDDCPADPHMHLDVQIVIVAGR